MKTRTSEELNAIIHKWMKADEPPQPEILLLNAGDGRSYLKDERPPNYCGDLNAVHEAEGKLQIEKIWLMTAILAEIVDPGLPIAYATARQRAEALVRVIEGGEMLTEARVPVTEVERMKEEVERAYVEGYDDAGGSGYNMTLQWKTSNARKVVEGIL